MKNFERTPSGELPGQAKTERPARKTEAVFNEMQTGLRLLDESTKDALAEEDCSDVTALHVIRANAEVGRIKEAESLLEIMEKGPSWRHAAALTSLAIEAQKAGKSAEPYLEKTEELLHLEKSQRYQNHIAIELAITEAKLGMLDSALVRIDGLRKHAKRTALGWDNDFEHGMEEVAVTLARQGRLREAEELADEITGARNATLAYSGIIDELLKDGKIVRAKKVAFKLPQTSEASDLRSRILERVIASQEKDSPKLGRMLKKAITGADASASREERGYWQTVRARSLVNIGRADLAKVVAKTLHPAEFDLPKYLAERGMYDEAFETATELESKSERLPKIEQIKQIRTRSAETPIKPLTSREVQHNIEALAYAAVTDIDAGRSPESGLKQLHEIVDSAKLPEQDHGSRERDLLEYAKMEIIRIECHQLNFDGAKRIARKWGRSINGIIDAEAERGKALFVDAMAKARKLSGPDWAKFARTFDIQDEQLAQAS